MSRRPPEDYGRCVDGSGRHPSASTGTCPQCGSDLPSSRATYCSPQCRKAAYGERRTDAAPKGKRREKRDAKDLKRREERDARLFRDIVWALGEHAQSGGSAWGSSSVVKRVAVEYDIDVTMLRLPRPSRATREDQGWESRYSDDWM